MSGGDEQPDEAADEPAERSGDEADDAAVDKGEEPVDDADRDRPDSPHRDPRTADTDGDEADSDDTEAESDGTEADSDEEATPGVGSGGSTDAADGSPEPENEAPDHADPTDEGTDQPDTDAEDPDTDADDADGGMPDWEEKQWGPREEDVDDGGGNEVDDETERPYDPAFDDSNSDPVVPAADLGGGRGADNEDGDDSDDADDSDDMHVDHDVDGDSDVDDDADVDGESSGDDADEAGNIVAVDQDADELTHEEGAASDGGTVSVGEDNTIGGAADEHDGGGFGGFREGPEYDQEMPLADHVEEMMTRLLTVIVVMAVVSAPAFLFADTIIQYVWDSILGAAGSEAKPHVYRPLSLVLARLKTATLAGFIIALPVFVYETYRFMRPGLYPKERRYYLAAVPTSLVLASVGVLFAFYLVLPAIFVYFVTYSEGAAVIAFGLTDTYGLMLTMMGFFALIFQIPLFIMLAIMMGLTTRKWLADRRILFWGAFAGLSALFAFDPTGMAPIIVALTMIVLFEGTLFMLRWVERGKAFFARRDADSDA